jgi:hypothetical protein
MKRFDDGQFDVVVDGNCLHCVLGDARRQALASVKRILAADRRPHTAAPTRRVARLVAQSGLPRANYW